MASKRRKTITLYPYCQGPKATKQKMMLKKSPGNIKTFPPWDEEQEILNDSVILILTLQVLLMASMRNQIDESFLSQRIVFTATS